MSYRSCPSDHSSRIYPANLTFRKLLRSAAKLGNKKLTERVEWNDPRSVALGDGGARHAGNYTSIFALGDSDSTSGFNGAETFGSVFTHAGHENANSREPEFLSDGMEENID